MEPDVDAFLEHYGKKGMKWGVTTANPNGVQPSRKQVRQVTKETRKENRKELRGQLKARSGGEKARTFALDMATFGGYSTAKMAQSAGFSKGRTAALAMMPGYGMMIVAETKVQKDVRAKLGG